LQLASKASNRGLGPSLSARVLRRDDVERTEFITISLWDSLDSIEGFAGAELVVVFYPEDDRYLVERENFVTHYEPTGP
jgi:hypothetical protein